METEARWAGAWVRVLRGEAPWPEPRGEAKDDTARTATPRAERVAGGRAWAREILGITSSATAEEVTRAFRAAAFRTHPDSGGSEAAFIAVRKAYEVALDNAKSSPRKRRRAR